MRETVEINQKLLSKELIEREIRAKIKPTVRVFDSIDSTNAEAKRLAADEYSSPTLIIANSQTSGRGRMGRSFYSPAEHGLYMSLLYKCNSNMTDAVSVTTAAAVAVALSIEETSGCSTQIKWVNDIYMNGGKVSGILAESVISGGEKHVIIGIGINITTESFPEEIKNIAASVGKDISRASLAAKVYGRLIEYIDSPPSAYMSEYRKRSMLDGCEVSAIYKDKTVFGKVMGVSDSGGLILLPDGETVPITIISGEVSIRARK